MSHAPKLYAILLIVPSDAMTVEGMNDGDWIFIQGPAQQRGYYTFIPGMGPPGAILAPGGWLQPFVGGGGGGLEHRSVQVLGGIGPAGGTFPLVFGVAMPNANYDVFIETDYFVSYYVTNKTINGFDLVVGVGTGGNANAQAFARI